MAVNTVTTCDCCSAELPTSALPDVMLVTRIDEDQRVLITDHYGYLCGCAQRIVHAIGLEINKHDSLHKPPNNE